MVKKHLIIGIIGDFDQIKQYNSTSKDFQLEILKKWYPVGMPCGIRTTIGKQFTNDDVKYGFIIIEHIEMLGYWHLKIESNKLDIYGYKQNYTNIKHPIRLIPEPNFQKQLIRQYNLDNLL